MNLKEFSSSIKPLAIYPDADSGSNLELAYLGLGLGGETGEAVDCIKKILRNEGDDETYFKQRDKLMEELGDVLWYWVRLCNALDFDPEDIMDYNVEKLEARQAEGTLAKR